VTGDWSGAEGIRADLHETVGHASGGEFIVPAPISARVIDALRNASQVFSAGAISVPMSSNTLSIPRLTDSVDVQWHAEGTALTPATQQWDRVQLSTRTVAVILKASVELIEDVEPQVADGITNDLAQQLALEVDRVCLYGNGTTEPEGIVGQTGVQTPLPGTADWDDIIDQVGTLRGANTNPNAIVWGSEIASTIAKLKGNDQYLQPPSYIAGLARLESNQVSPGGVFIGDFTQMLVGIRTDLRLARLLTERYIDELNYGYLAYIRMDVALAHPEAFSYSAPAT
jgi:HK97 family phage major capsid protein